MSKTGLALEHVEEEYFLLSRMAKYDWTSGQKRCGYLLLNIFA